MDDIIFGGNDEVSNIFFDEIKCEFEIYMIGEMKYFLQLQITQTKDGIFVSQTNYFKDFLVRFGI